MKINDILRESLLRGEADERLYDILNQTSGVGPFDGGCVIIAQALQKVFGGDIVVLLNTAGEPEHAAVQFGQDLIDYDGKLPVKDFIKRFERNEMVEISGLRKMQSSDLPEAPRDDAAVLEIAKLFQRGR